MKTTMHKYRFEDCNSDEYKEFCDRLKGMGLRKVFFTLVRDLRGVGEEVVELNTEFLFDNQWNSDKGRIFDWFEDWCEGSIRYGYWLEQTDEMKEARRKRYKCGFCGKQYVDGPGWCLACLGSKYLKEEDLPLLKLYCVTQGFARTDGVTVPEYMTKAYHAVQTTRNNIEMCKEIHNER